MSAVVIPVAPAIPWYRSPVVIAQVSSMITGLVAIVPKNDIVTALGLANPVAVNNDVTLVFGVIAGIAQLVALIARARSKIQPVTLTQIGADMHVNTLTYRVQAGKTGDAGQSKPES